MKSFLALAVAAALASCVYGASVGDGLHRSYNTYKDLPMTAYEAGQMNWHSAGSSCDPNLGIAYNYKKDVPTKDYPITLYYTVAGQVAGVGTDIFGSVPSNLLSMGYFTEVGDKQYRITVSFRSSNDVCAKTNSSEPLGDTLVVNQGALGKTLPITEDDAKKSKWTAGACFHTMGTHYFYDLATAPTMSWNAYNLLPVVPMYSNGTLSAIFFASTDVQQSLLDSHMWDLVALPDFAMCKNWCSDDCHWTNTNEWSTMHIFTREDYDAVKCADNCKISCCPGE